MTASTSSLSGTIFATIAALLAGADCTSAADRVATGDSSYCSRNLCQPDSRPRESGSGTSTILSNDRTSRYVALVEHKSIALDLPGDVSDVFIADPKIANVVLRSKRRAFVVATGLGQTNVFFYDAKGKQIDGLNVNVWHHEISQRIPEREILVVRGARDQAAQMETWECTPICAKVETAKAEKPPPPLLVIPTAPAVSQP
jgi:Flp pilus assembly secretin CpaC